MKKILSVVVVMAVISSANAAVDCSYAKVLDIQAQRNNILVHVTDGSSGAWRTLGDYTAIHLKAFLGLAQQAMATESRIELRFPDGTNCMASDYSTVPEMLRLVGAR